MHLSTPHFSTTITTLFVLLLLHIPHLSATSHRRLLHHPFFPLSPSITQPPSLPPSSSISSFSGNTATSNLPFFPTFPSSPPPPPPPPPPPLPPPSSTALPTFPANISSLSLPSTSSPPSHSPLSSKLIITLILLSLLTLSLIISLSLLLHRRRNHHHHPHFSPQKPISPPSPPPSKPPSHMTNSRNFQPTTSTTTTTTIEPPHSSEFYLKLCGNDSPELRPLPTLPKTTTTTSSQHLRVTFDNNVQIHYSENNDDFGLNISPTRSYSDFQCSDSDVSVEIQTLAARTHHFPAPPPPPPPPPGVGPPPLVPPSGPVVFKSSGNLGEKGKSGERKEESGTIKTKLKALHWDKVRASSDRVMVWDHLHPGSFQ